MKSSHLPKVTEQNHMRFPLCCSQLRTESRKYPLAHSLDKHLTAASDRDKEMTKTPSLRGQRKITCKVQRISRILAMFVAASREKHMLARDEVREVGEGHLMEDFVGLSWVPLKQSLRPGFRCK